MFVSGNVHVFVCEKENEWWSSLCKNVCFCLLKNTFFPSLQSLLMLWSHYTPSLFIINNILIPSIHLLPRLALTSRYLSLYLYIFFTVYTVSADTTPAPPSLKGSGRTETKHPLWPCSHRQDD